MRRSAFVIAAVMLFACKTGQGPGQISPPAAKPMLEEVASMKATFSKTSGTLLGTNQYDLLPAGAVRINFDVPNFTVVDVYQDGSLLTRANATPGTPIAAGTWVGDVVKNDQNTSTWAITLNTASFANQNRSWIGIRDRSVNSNYIGNQRVSDALNVCAFDATQFISCPFAPATTPVAPAAGVAFTQGVDCQCNAIGAYLSPAKAKDPSVISQTGLTGSSPNGVYNVQFVLSGGNTTNVQVTRAANGALVVNDTFTGTAAEYAFSADDDRFAYSFTDAASNRVTRIHDASNPNSPPVFDRSSNASRVFAGFSPNSKYLVYATANSAATGPGGTASIEVVDSKTGTAVYQSGGFAYSTPAGGVGAQFPPVNFGFAPGVGDRTLAFWRWTGTNGGQWTVVNLAGPKVIIDRPFSGQSLALFSPCGDILALIDQTATSSAVTGYQTRDGQTVGAQLTFPGNGTPSGQTTAGQQQIKIGTSTQTLTTNAANQSC